MDRKILFLIECAKLFERAVQKEGVQLECAICEIVYAYMEEQNITLQELEQFVTKESSVVYEDVQSLHLLITHLKIKNKMK